MKNPLLYLSVFILAISSCTRTIFPDLEKESILPASNSDSLSLKLIANDLSEDMSRLSTKNDEIVLLIYSDTMGQLVPDLILSEYHLIDKVNSNRTIRIKNDFSDSHRLTFVLIEVDTEKSLQQIEPVIRLNLYNLMQYDTEGNVRGLNKLLGDDDLLGIQQIPVSDIKKRGLNIIFKGIHLFDSYNYGLEINSNFQKKKKSKK